MNRAWKLLAIALSGSLTACASGIHHVDRLGDGPAAGRVMFIDAKQRALTVVPATTTTTTTWLGAGKTTADSQQTVTNLRVCAEPSPDALTAVATSASGKLDVESKINLAAAFSQAETAGSIGLRTQSIQLMRDVLFRVCEMYQSGALTPGAAETMVRRYQSSLVAILAIEQLTGTVKAAPIVLGSGASTGAAKEVANLATKTVAARDAADAADKELATATGEKGTADAALAALKADKLEQDPAKMDAARKADFDAKAKAVDDAAKHVAAAQGPATAAKATLATYEKAIAALGGGDTSAVASGAAYAGSGSDAAKSAVADQVYKIVNDTLSLGFLREACATMIVATIEGRSAEYPNVTAPPNPGSGPAATGTSFADTCKAYSDQTVQMAAANVRHIDAQTTLLLKLDPNRPDFAAKAAAINAAVNPTPAAVQNAQLMEVLKFETPGTVNLQFDTGKAIAKPAPKAGGGKKK